MSRVAYKGYVIDARPKQTAGDGQWTIDLTIERHDGDSVTERPFSAANLFPTKEEATQHCVLFGRQIIDGRVEGCTAP